jgi:hypothetical protein
VALPLFGASLALLTIDIPAGALPEPLAVVGFDRYRHPGIIMATHVRLYPPIPKISADQPVVKTRPLEQP